MRAPKTFFVQATANRLPFKRGTFHNVTTSIPYYKQRAYGQDAHELGREPVPEIYVARIVRMFDEVARVMRNDATLFLNIGDTYDSRSGNLIGIPWMVAQAMKAAGWILRAEIIWAKAISFGDAHAENVRAAVRREARRLGLSKDVAARLASVVEPQVGACMPSSVTDRPTTSHETLFLFTGRRDYFCDWEPLKEAGKDWGERDRSDWKYTTVPGQAKHNGCKDNNFAEKGRNLRSVWTINPQPYHTTGEKHYATYPERLAAPCVRAGTSDAGCCSVCGAPFLRVVEKTKIKRARPNEYVKRTGAAGTGNKVANTVSGVASRTMGFETSCSCGPAQGVTTPVPVPCRVLDPCGGIATTALAANAHGRDCVVVDLYHEFLIEGRNRLLRRRGDAATVVPVDRKPDPPESDPDQLELSEV